MTARIALLSAGALAILIGAVVWAGASPREALHELIQGSLGSKGAVHGTLKETMPLMIAGLAVYLALRAGLFNIGVEGQLVMGAATCAAVALAVPGALGMVYGLATGALAGGLWALPAGLIKAYRGGHEVISTIMLNSVAGFLTQYLVAGPLKAPGQENTTTASLDPASMLPALFASAPLKISGGLLVGVLAIAVAAFWLKRSVAGYELCLVGANPRAAEFAGVATRRVTVKAMAVSGAIAGFAGALQVVGYEGRFYAGFSPGYGFDALGVAILAGASPWGLLPSAFLFGMLSKGATSVQFIGVPKGISVVLVGLLIIVFAAVRFRKEAAHD